MEDELLPKQQIPRLYVDEMVQWKGRSQNTWLQRGRRSCQNYWVQQRIAFKGLQLGICPWGLLPNAAWGQKNSHKAVEVWNQGFPFPQVDEPAGAVPWAASFERASYSPFAHSPVSLALAAWMPGANPVDLD